MPAWDLLVEILGTRVQRDPRLNAFCLVAPTVRFRVLAMVAACFFFLQVSSTCELVLVSTRGASIPS